MGKTIEVTLTATFEYDSENFDDLDTLTAEAMALDTVSNNLHLLTSSFEVEE